MKKNFLVTTGLVDTWEFNETNFLLGKWCELYEFSDFNKKQFVEKIPTKIVFERNIHHWEDNKKKDEDLKYLEEKLDYLLPDESNNKIKSIIHELCSQCYAELEEIFPAVESAELAVNYSKTRPDLFKDGAEVIVTGEYRNGIFVADELQTKCASRYEGDLREESNYKLEELET